MTEKPKSPIQSVIDPSVLGAAGEAMRSFSTVDPKTVGLAHDAARNWARVSSIIDPNAYIEPGYPKGIMPDSFGAVIPKAQLDALVAYLAGGGK